MNLMQDKINCKNKTMLVKFNADVKCHILEFTKASKEIIPSTTS